MSCYRFDTETEDTYRWFYVQHGFTQNSINELNHFVEKQQEEKRNEKRKSDDRCKTPMFLKSYRMEKAYQKHVDKMRQKKISSKQGSGATSFRADASD